jgi:hypothetical protein
MSSMKIAPASPKAETSTKQQELVSIKANGCDPILKKTSNYISSGNEKSTIGTTTSGNAKRYVIFEYI